MVVDAGDLVVKARIIMLRFGRMQAVLILSVLTTAVYAQETCSTSQGIYHCLEKRRGPLVVFVSGLGDDHQGWKKVVHGMTSVSTFRYDRLGSGRSAWREQPRNPEFIARELHQLLRVAKAKPPYILVGHSLGGVYVRTFYMLYPKDVAGLVLVDPSDSLFPTRLESALPREEFVAWKAIRDRNLANGTVPSQREVAASEENNERLTRLRIRVPIVVLTAMRVIAGNPAMSAVGRQTWCQLHEEWLQSQPNATHVLVDDSTHYIHDKSPTSVIAAIDAVKNFRIGHKLPLTQSCPRP